MTSAVTDPLIPIFSRSNLYGWPSTVSAQGRANKPASGSEAVQYVPLSTMLSNKAVTTDAHFAAYSAPEHPYRLNRGAEKMIPGGVPMVLLVFDIDCAKNLRVDKQAPDSWRASERVKIDRLFADQPGLYCFYTRGGYRLLGRTPEPFYIVNDATAQEWSKYYIIMGANLYRKYDILVDPKCRNWHRLQRCPYAVR